jgi:hypothetical protein
MCRELVRVLKDLRVSILALGVIDEGEPQFDYEGVDFLATQILNGLSNWITNLKPEDWSTQPKLLRLAHKTRVEAQFELIFAVVP